LGAENGDKCAWTFSGAPVNFPNGSSWKIQGNYSNAAAAARSGYDGAEWFEEPPSGGFS
jgi:hypothetical protein